MQDLSQPRPHARAAAGRARAAEARDCDTIGRATRFGTAFHARAMARSEAAAIGATRHWAIGRRVRALLEFWWEKVWVIGEQE